MSNYAVRLVFGIFLALYAIGFSHGQTIERVGTGAGTIDAGSAGQSAYYSDGTTITGDSSFTRTASGQYLLEAASSETQLVLKNAPTQTGAIFEHQNSSGTPIVELFSGGRLDTQLSRTFGLSVGAFGSPSLTTPIGVEPAAADRVAVTIRGHATQTAALVQIQDGTPTTMVEFLADGSLDFTTGTLKTADSQNVASATTTALPIGNLFHVTGTTSITTLDTCDAANNGRDVTLIFDGALTFTDGNNLVLAGDFVTTANDTISLVCDGVSWFEKARSVN